jgi:hypothetical protein
MRFPRGPRQSRSSRLHRFRLVLLYNMIRRCDFMMISDSPAVWALVVCSGQLPSTGLVEVPFARDALAC